MKTHRIKQFEQIYGKKSNKTCNLENSKLSPFLAFPIILFIILLSPLITLIEMFMFLIYCRKNSHE